MTIEEALAKLAEKYKFVDGELSAYAPNGQPYVTIGASGFDDEGKDIAGVFFSESAAVENWYLWAKEYGEGVGGNVLYWRVKPEVDTIPMYKDERAYLDISDLTPVTVYKVRARLLITQEAT